MNINARISIACVSYNHEKWIGRALDSCLMQKLNEPFNIVIYDDKSTDNTYNIIKEYQKNYPDIISIIPTKENLFSKGINGSRQKLYPAIKSQYVVITDGDDYFIDPYKLQKQVNFLDTHPDYSMCFHPVKILFEDKKAYSIFPDKNEIKNNNIEFNFENLLHLNFIQTNSCMYRWRFASEDVFQLLPDEILPEDHFIHLLHAQKGKIGFIDEIMAVYWKHTNSLWNNNTFTKEWYLSCGIRFYSFLLAIYETFQYDTRVNIFLHLPNLIVYATQENRNDILDKIFQKNEAFFLYSLKQMLQLADPFPQIAKQTLTTYFNK